MPDFKPFSNEAPPAPDNSIYILPEGWTHVGKDVEIPIPCNLIYPDGGTTCVRYPDGFYAAEKGYVGFQRVIKLGTVERYNTKLVNRLNSPLYGERSYWAVWDVVTGYEVAKRIASEGEAVEIAAIFNSSQNPI
jgi:hypothetical protein|tara:strand:- start:2067 stop:2468 length:402 start_codon:yes stop_codon:yes gene_type:complete